jgi:hypothetical protein
MIRIYLKEFALNMLLVSIRGADLIWTEIPDSELESLNAFIEKTRMNNSEIAKNLNPLSWDYQDQAFKDSRHKLQDLYSELHNYLTKVDETDNYIFIHDFFIEISEGKKNYEAKIVNH